MIAGILLAASVTLTPFDEYLGSLPGNDVCVFRYGPRTSLAPGTIIRVDPYNATYGAGSRVPPGDGMDCKECAVPRMDMIDNGNIIIQCEYPK